MLLRLTFLSLTIAALSAAQAPPASPPASPAAALMVVPRIGVVDFYGLNKVPEDRIRKTLGFRDGDPFPRSKAEVEEHLDELPGVVESHLEAVCCDAGKMVMYVGIEERGAAHFDL